MARKVKGDKKKSKKKQALTPEEERTRMITVLATKCNLKTEDVEEAYDKFHSKYKDGFIKREEYIQSRKVKKILSLNFPPVCPQNTMMAESLFRVFDEDKSGTLSFDEYLQATQVGDLETVEDKLSWIFTAFDADGGGSIDNDEIYDICEGLFRLAGIEDDPDLLASCVSDVRWVKAPSTERFIFLSELQSTVMATATSARRSLSKMPPRASSSLTS